MNESKKIFFATTSIIIIILLVVLIILISSSMLTTHKTVSSVDVYSVNNSTNDINLEKVSKIDDTKEMIYGVEDEYNIKVDSVDINIKSKMPVINIDTDDVKFINEEIKNYYDENKKSKVALELKYEYYIYKNNLSLVIKGLEANTVASKNIYNCIVYNINIEKGSINTNLNLSSIKNTNNQKIYDKLLSTIKSNLKNNYNFDISNNKLLTSNGNTAQEYILQELDDNLISGKNKLDMYLDESGKLNVSLKTPILNVQKKEVFVIYRLSI